MFQLQSFSAYQANIYRQEIVVIMLKLYTESAQYVSRVNNLTLPEKKGHLVARNFIITDLHLGFPTTLLFYRIFFNFSLLLFTQLRSVSCISKQRLV